MSLLSWIFGGRKPGRRDFRIRVERVLGPWKPHQGSAVISGTRLPKSFDVPPELLSEDASASRTTFSQALFPYWLRIDPSFAGFLASRIRAGEMYVRKEIPREGKAPREISVPAPVLKFVQRRILARLLDQIDIHPAAHGFVGGRSIFTAAAPHVGRRMVVALDIRDFFGSISFPRVLGLFKSLGVAKKQALLLASLCTFEKKLPQGAPTSPAISNIICRRLDSRITGICRRHGFNYTRYADDLVFSGDEKLVGFIRIFKDIVAKEGFTVAEEKTFIRRSGSRQRILGLNVNTKLSVPRKVRRTLRAMAHAQSRSGSPEEGMKSFILGHAAFMKPAHPEQAERLRNQVGRLP